MTRSGRAIGIAFAIAFVVCLVHRVDAGDDPSFRVLLQFPVTDERMAFSVALSRDVSLDIRRTVDAKGLHMGWDLAAVDRRIKESPNFFYECRCGHGPRPHDLYAWHFVGNYFPSERDLPVYGYPLEVRVRCVDCEATGRDGSDAQFVRGTVEIGLRRLATANPRQLRISDVVRGDVNAK
jgi:hypothetical protein